MLHRNSLLALFWASLFLLVSCLTDSKKGDNLVPAITAQPQNIAVNEGSTATFTVTATGSGSLSYQWQRNGTDISGANLTSYTTPPVLAADNSARYRCVVSNSAGSVPSNEAVLTVTTVITPPSITTQPQNDTVDTGSTANFTVIAAGSGSLSYQWQKNGADISGANFASYTTPPVLAADNGARYHCVVSNSAGLAITIEATLTVTTSGNVTLITGTANGIFRSQDYGNSWTQVNNGLTSTSIRSITANNTHLFAGIYNGGVFRSLDNGDSWTQVGTGLTNTRVITLTATGPYLFVGNFGGAFRSQDNGDSWIPVLLDYSVFSFQVNGAYLFAGFNRGIFRSINNGSTWTQVSNGLINTTVHSFAIRDTLLFAGTEWYGLYRSNDNGNSWYSKNNGLTNTDVRSIFVSGANFFAGTNGGGVFRSTDNGDSWTEVNNGLTSTSVYSILIGSALP